VPAGFGQNCSFAATLEILEITTRAIDYGPNAWASEAKSPVRKLVNRKLCPLIFPTSRVCLICSFQAEDTVVFDLLRKRIPDIPVLFLETGYHFAATYEFRDRPTREWQLNLVNAAAKKTLAEQESKLGILS
jgi:3'-phosphoadenosine 5'-phosphosulfate sulfotransferase (PAPS reductase)/FAD synthetase